MKRSKAGPSIGKAVAPGSRKRANLPGSVQISWWRPSGGPRKGAAGRHPSLLDWSWVVDARIGRSIRTVEETQAQHNAAPPPRAGRAARIRPCRLCQRTRTGTRAGRLRSHAAGRATPWRPCCADRDHKMAGWFGRSGAMGRGRADLSGPPSSHAWVHASGDVHDMTGLAQFPGIYGRASRLVSPGAQMHRSVWLRNTPVVRLRIYQASWTSTDGKVLQRRKIASGGWGHGPQTPFFLPILCDDFPPYSSKNGVWGPWPQPPEALEFDGSSFAESGNTAQSDRARGADGILIEMV